MTHFCIQSNLYVPTKWIISFDCSLKTSNAKKRIHNIFLPLAPVPSKYGCECPSVPARARLYAGHSVRYPPHDLPTHVCAHSCSRWQCSGHTFLQPTLNTQLLTLGCQADPGHWWPGEITLQTAGGWSTQHHHPHPAQSPPDINLCEGGGGAWWQMAWWHDGMMTRFSLTSCRMSPCVPCLMSLQANILLDWWDLEWIR